MARTTHLTAFVSAIAITAALGTAAPVQAADLLMPEIIEAPEVPVHKPKSGWYLRGDITYDWRELRGIHDNHFNAPYNSVSIEDTWDVGLGIGYQVNDYLRLDLTGEYQFGTEVTGSNVVTDLGCDKDTAVSETCTYTDTTDVSTLKIMANAYADLGHFGGLTPYVGAGIGGAYVMYDDYTHTHLNQPDIGGGACGLCGLTTNTSEREGSNSWRFAWALHAGAAYKLTENLKLDVGYTFSRIEGGEMDYDRTTGARSMDNGFNDHIIHAGLRYSFW